MAITCRFTLTTREVVNATWINYRRERSWIWKRMVPAILLFGIVAISGVKKLRDGERPPVEVLLVTTMLLFFGFLIASIIRRSREFAARWGEAEYEFSSDSVRITTLKEKAEAKWSAFEYLLELTTMFLMYRNERTFNIIPKRTFASQEEMEQFRSLATSAIAAAKAGKAT